MHTVQYPPETGPEWSLCYVRKALTGEAFAVDAMVRWAGTPQGWEFWRCEYQAVILSPTARAYLEEVLAYAEGRVVTAPQTEAAPLDPFAAYEARRRAVIEARGLTWQPPVEPTPAAFPVFPAAAMREQPVERMLGAWPEDKAPRFSDPDY